MSESLTHELFDTLLEPVFILNEDLKVLYCNETASVMVGLTQRRIQKMTFPEVLQFSEPIDWLAKIKEVTDPTPYKEIRFTNQEAQEGRIQITCRKYPQSENQWILFVRDVTLEDRLQKKYRAELEQKEGYIEELKSAQSQLEAYSKNLEKMVAERTLALSKLNQLMSALLDSLGQGFFVFDSNGLVLEVSSKACMHTLEQDPKGKYVWQILGVPENKVDGFKKWMVPLFAEMLPFEDIAPLGPAQFSHSKNLHISLEYFPLRSAEGKIEGVVVVASDVTSLVEAKRRAEEQKKNAQFILNLLQTRREMSRFVSESVPMLKELSDVAARPGPWDTNHLFRLLHTLKGGAASFAISPMDEICHGAENLLAELKVAYENSDGKKARATELELTRQNKKIDESFFNFKSHAESLIGTKAFSTEKVIEWSESEFRDLIALLRSSGLNQLAQKLIHDHLLDPVKEHILPYDQLIQKIALSLGKKVNPLKIEGGDTRLPSQKFGHLFACLVHAFRNAVDHGIETPEARLAKGKPAEGTISVELSKGADHLLLKIEDDGGGIDPQRIREKLRQKGYLNEDETDKEVIQHVMDPQFSTRDTVTELSGRGVGMDAIKTAAEALSGKAWVESEAGKGTTLWISIPHLSEISLAKAS